MIPGRGWVATFRDEGGGESRSPVLYFDDEGRGWVCPSRTPQRADLYKNFCGFVHVGEVVGIPASLRPGWHLCLADDELSGGFVLGYLVDEEDTVRVLALVGGQPRVLDPGDILEWGPSGWGRPPK